MAWSNRLHRYHVHPPVPWQFEGEKHGYHWHSPWRRRRPSLRPFASHVPSGPSISIPLHSGCMYAFSQHACGADWKAARDNTVFRRAVATEMELQKYEQLNETIWDERRVCTEKLKAVASYESAMEIARAKESSVMHACGASRRKREEGSEAKALKAAKKRHAKRRKQLKRQRSCACGKNAEQRIKAKEQKRLDLIRYGKKRSKRNLKENESVH